MPARVVGEAAVYEVRHAEEWATPFDFLGIALGGRIETFAGLSGVSDLIVTCFSSHARNHRVGFALGGGNTLEEAVAALGMVAEGMPNTLSIHDVARRVGVRTPTTDSVIAILYEGKFAPIAIKELLTRDLRPELRSSVAVHHSQAKQNPHRSQSPRRRLEPQENRRPAWHR